MNKMKTDLEVHVTLLQNYYANHEVETNYLIKYYPSKLIYQKDLINYNDVVRDYAFKMLKVHSIYDVVEDIKSLYVKVLEIPYMRLDIVFEATDIAHKSTETRYDSNARIILNDNFIAYNKQISEDDRKFILDEMLSYKGYTRPDNNYF